MKLFRPALVTALLLVAVVAHAQDKPLRIVLGYPPGASSDTLMRLLADRLRPLLGQAIIPENKPGAGGIIGNETVKAAPPDGTTLLLTPVATMAAFPIRMAQAFAMTPSRTSSRSHTSRISSFACW